MAWCLCEDGPARHLRLLLGETVVAAVDHLTRRKGESCEAFIQRLKPHPLARKVKLADLKDLGRLPDPQPKDLERLGRYQKAWAELDGGSLGPASQRSGPTPPT